MRNGAKRVRRSRRRLQIHILFGCIALILCGIAAVGSKSKLVQSSNGKKSENVINLHMMLGRDTSLEALNEKLEDLAPYSCVLHLYSHLDMQFDNNYAQCSVKSHRSRIGATWADIPLVGDGSDVIIQNGAFSMTTEDVRWIENARKEAHGLEMQGARQDIAAFVIQCQDGSACAISPHVSRTGGLLWDDFRDWYAARRAEWRIWPHITKEFGSTPRFRRSRSNKKRDRSLTRIGQLVGHSYQDASATWQIWYDRWVEDYSLRSIVKNGKKLETLLGEAWDEREFATENGGEAYMSALKDVVAAASDGQRVAMTIVDNAFMDLTRNWLCNVKTGGFVPSGIVWLTLSEEVKAMVDGTGIGTTVDLTGALKDAGEEMPNILYGHKTYWKLMLLRTRLIADLVSRGVEVFLFETDQTWLKDPFAHIERELNAGADMVGTLDTQHNVAGNTLYLRPTLPTRKLWSEVYRRFKASYDEVGVETMEESESSFVEHDQHSLSDLLLYNEEFRSEHPVALGLLNADLFVGGSWYSGFYKSEESRTPVVINNNFISGVGRKKKRAIEFGHWFIDRNGKCLSEVVKKALEYEFPNGPPVPINQG